MVFSRHGVITSARGIMNPRVLGPVKTTALLVAGAVIIGIGVSLFVHAELGLSPYDVLLSAIAERSGLMLGQATWVASAVLYLVAALLGRPPAPWSLLYIFVIGISVDGSMPYIETAHGVGAQIFMATLAFVFFLVGLGLVVRSGATGGPFELLMNAGGDRGFKRERVRLFMEVTVVIVGIAAGGDYGPATLVVAVLIGPGLITAIQFYEDHRVGRRIRLANERAS